MSAIQHDPQTGWPVVRGVLVPGHGVASGRSGDPRFPGGTIVMQTPHFQARGLDVSGFYLGTLNVSIAPRRYRVLAPRMTFRAVRWHPTEPPEDFSFMDARIGAEARPLVDALIYYPHPDTKPAHAQPPDVLEVLAPRVDGLGYGNTVRVAVNPRQLHIESYQIREQTCD